jgi:hypothetical protein
VSLFGVVPLDADGLKRPCGHRDDLYGEEPTSALVLHINHEVIRRLTIFN